jgi:hypothetical protein
VLVADILTIFSQLIQFLLQTLHTEAMLNRMVPLSHLELDVYEPNGDSLTPARPLVLLLHMEVVLLEVQKQGQM